METWRRQFCLRLQRSRGKPSLMVAGSPQRVRPLAGRIACVTKKKRRRPFPGRRRSPIAPKIGTVIPASRREALYGRSSYLDAPSEWHRASSAGPD